MQRVHVGDPLGVVEAEDGAKPHDGQQQSEEQERGVQQLPGELVLTPGQGDAVQHGSCGGGGQKEKMVNSCENGATSWLEYQPEHFGLVKKEFVPIHGSLICASS